MSASRHTQLESHYFTYLQKKERKKRKILPLCKIFVYKHTLPHSQSVHSYFWDRAETTDTARDEVSDVKLKYTGRSGGSTSTFGGTASKK